MSVLPYFPLAGGALTGKYRRGEPAPAGHAPRRPTTGGGSPTRTSRASRRSRRSRATTGTRVGELAQAWLASQRVVCSVISGATRPEQVRENVAAVEWRLSADDLRAVDAALADAAGRGLSSGHGDRAVHEPVRGVGSAVSAVFDRDGERAATRTQRKSERDREQRTERDPQLVRGGARERELRAARLCGDRCGRSRAAAAETVLPGAVVVGVVAAGFTMMVPCMFECTRQWYANVPAVAKTCEYELPGLMHAPAGQLGLESNAPVSEVTLWITPPVLVQVTVVPAVTVIVAGE